MNSSNKIKTENIHSEITDMSSVDAKKVNEIIMSAPVFKSLDENESAKRGREICKRYSRYLQVSIKQHLSKENGFLGNGSVIRSPEKNSFSRSDRMLRQMIREENDPISEFFNIVDCIGQVYPPCREYLILTYYYCLTPKEISKMWKMAPRQVCEIQRIAHALVAYLTGNGEIK